VHWLAAISTRQRQCGTGRLGSQPVIRCSIIVSPSGACHSFHLNGSRDGAAVRVTVLYTHGATPSSHWLLATHDHCAGRQAGRVRAFFQHHYHTCCQFLLLLIIYKDTVQTSYIHKQEELIDFANIV
jgi:hypothetical protein